MRREKRGCRRAGGWTDERTCSAVWGRKGREEGRKGHRSAREKRSPEWASSFFCHLDPLNFSQIAHARARAASEGRGAGPGLGGTTNKWLFASVLLLLLLFLRLDSRMEWRRPEGKCHFAVRESKDAARTLPPLARRVNGRGNTHTHTHTRTPEHFKGSPYPLPCPNRCRRKSYFFKGGTARSILQGD